MIKGLKKVFSKGSSSAVDSLEATLSQHNEAQLVRPRSKSAGVPTDSPEAATPFCKQAASSLSGQQSTLPAGGSAAWEFGTISEPATSPRLYGRRSSATISSASPSAAAPQLSPSPSATSSALQPPVAAKAWDAPAAAGKGPQRPYSEKETPIKSSLRLSGLFKSGSRNARSILAEGPTSGEAAGAPAFSGKDAQQRHSPENWEKESASKLQPRLSGLFRSGSSKNGRGGTAAVETSVELLEPFSGGGGGSGQPHDDEKGDYPPTMTARSVRHSPQIQPASELLDDTASHLAVRGGGALRAGGSRMAAPLPLESRRGPHAIG